MLGKGQRKCFLSAVGVAILGTFIVLAPIEPSYGQSAPQLYVVRGEVLVLTSGQTIEEGHGIALSMTDQLLALDDSEAVIGCAEVRLVPVGVRTDVKTLCQLSESKLRRGILPNWVWKLVRSAYRGHETSKALAGTKGDRFRDKAVHIIAPAQDTIVLTSTPWFAWWGPAGDYQIAVLQGTRLVWSIEARGTARLMYPAGYDPLPVDGKKTQYTWEVTGLNGTAFASANFYVLDSTVASTMRQQLNEMSKNLERVGVRGKNKSLSLAGFLRREGLQAEAMNLLESALSSEPGDPELQLALEYVTGIRQR